MARLRCAAIFVLIASVAIASPDARNSTAQNQNAKPNPERLKAHEPKPEVQFAPYWTAEPGWHTELQLRNNRVASPLTVTPVVRTADGAETTLASVTLQPNDVQMLNLNDAFKNQAPQLLGGYGSLALRYSSPSVRNLYAVDMVYEDGHPIAFHVDVVNSPPKWPVGSREGIWWLPNSTATGYVIVANQSDKRLPVGLVLSDGNGKVFLQTVVLPPRAIERLSLRDWVSRAGLSGSFGGISLRADDNAGALNSALLLFDEVVGFSATLKMFDRDPSAKVEERDFARTGVWTTRAPMLALSQPDPFLSFPQGTVLQPALMIRNVTNQPRTVSLRFHWRSSSASGVTPPQQITLATLATQRMDVKALQDSGVIPREANWASVSLRSTGQPDDVIAIAESYDSSLRYGAQTPFSDQLSVHLEGAEWQVDSTHNSLIAIGNGGTKPVTAELTLLYGGGREHYRLEQTLSPDEQMWVDVGHLIYSQAPDRDGKLLPADLTSGTYELEESSGSEGDLGSLYEGRLTVDKTYGRATYACMICCGPGIGFFDPNPWLGPVGFAGPGNVMGTDQCSEQEEVLNYYYSRWTSGNSAILGVQPGRFTGVNPGGTTAAAQGTIPSGDGQDSRQCPVRTSNPSEPGNVQPTVAFSGAPPSGVAVVNGSAPGAHEVFINAVCNPQGKVNPQFNWSITQGSQFASLDTQEGNGPTMGIFGVQKSPTNAITVSLTCTDLNTNKTSPPITTTLTAQQPTSLAIVLPDTTVLNPDCTSGQCGDKRTFNYQVKDQSGTAITEGGLDFWDFITTGSANSCNLQKYNVTCGTVTSGQQTGSCNQGTFSTGQFIEHLGICAPVCGNASNGACPGSCSTAATQTWMVNGFPVSKSLTYQCNSTSVQ